MTKIKKMNKVESLYIHIPFCNHICNYCDFTKIIYNREIAILYCLDLIKDLKRLKVSEKRYKTIYIGGGTPSSLPYYILEKLILLCSSLLEEENEFTIELNVEDINKELLKILKKSKINRVSVGIESFNDEVLMKMNRNYDSSIIFNNITLLKKYFSNFNLDLIYALPFIDNVGILENDLKQIVSLNPTHISTYSLQIEKNTIFYNQKFETLNDSETRKQYDLIHNYLTQFGYKRYEISNYCKENYQSMHNLTYWHNKEYISLGAGSSGYENGIRYKYTCNILEYISTHKKLEEEVVNMHSKFEYFLYLNFRLDSGFQIDEINNIFSINFLDKYKNILERLTKEKLIFVDETSIRATYQGSLVLDNWIDLFF